MENKKSHTIINYGIYWDDCEEMTSIGVDIVEEMIKKGSITGSTYIYVMSKEYGVPVIDLTQKEIKNMEYEIISVKNDDLLLTVKDYYKYVTKDEIKGFDNIVFIIKDDPTYSLSNKSYTITTTIIDKKNSSPIIINVKHPIQMDYDYFCLEEYYDKKKALIKKICDKK